LEEDPEDNEDENKNELEDYEHGMASCLICGHIGPKGHKCKNCEDMAMFYVCDIDLNEEQEEIQE